MFNFKTYLGRNSAQAYISHRRPTYLRLHLHMSVFILTSLHILAHAHHLEPSLPPIRLPSAPSLPASPAVPACLAGFDA